MDLFDIDSFLSQDSNATSVSRQIGPPPMLDFLDQLDQFLTNGSNTTASTTINATFEKHEDSADDINNTMLSTHKQCENRNSDNNSNIDDDHQLHRAHFVSAFGQNTQENVVNVEAPPRLDDNTEEAISHHLQQQQQVSAESHQPDDLHEVEETTVVPADETITTAAPESAAEEEKKATDDAAVTSPSAVTETATDIAPETDNNTAAAAAAAVFAAAPEVTEEEEGEVATPAPVPEEAQVAPESEPDAAAAAAVTDAANNSEQKQEPEISPAPATTEGHEEVQQVVAEGGEQETTTTSTTTTTTAAEEETSITTTAVDKYPGTTTTKNEESNVATTATTANEAQEQQQPQQQQQQQQEKQQQQTPSEDEIPVAEASAPEEVPAGAATEEVQQQQQQEQQEPEEQQQQQQQEQKPEEEEATNQQNDENNKHIPLLEELIELLLPHAKEDTNENNNNNHDYKQVKDDNDNDDGDFWDEFSGPRPAPPSMSKTQKALKEIAVSSRSKLHQALVRLHDVLQRCEEAGVVGEILARNEGCYSHLLLSIFMNESLHEAPHEIQAIFLKALVVCAHQHQPELKVMFASSLYFSNFLAVLSSLMQRRLEQVIGLDRHDASALDEIKDMEHHVPFLCLILLNETFTADQAQAAEADCSMLQSLFNDVLLKMIDVPVFHDAEHIQQAICTASVYVYHKLEPGALNLQPDVFLSDKTTAKEKEEETTTESEQHNEVVVSAGEQKHGEEAAATQEACEPVFKPLKSDLTLTGDGDFIFKAIAEQCREYKLFAYSFASQLNRSENIDPKRFLTFLAALYSHQETAEYIFSLNDRNLLIDIIIRDLNNFTDPELRLYYFIALRSIIATETYQRERDRYRRGEIYDIISAILAANNNNDKAHEHDMIRLRRYVEKLLNEFRSILEVIRIQKEEEEVEASSITKNEKPAPPYTCGVLSVGGGGIEAIGLCKQSVTDALVANGITYGSDQTTPINDLQDALAEFSRLDALLVPFAAVIDHQTVVDNTVILRHQRARDDDNSTVSSVHQQRVSLEELVRIIKAYGDESDTNAGSVTWDQLFPSRQESNEIVFSPPQPPPSPPQALKKHHDEVVAAPAEAAATAPEEAPVPQQSPATAPAAEAGVKVPDLLVPTIPSLPETPPMPSIPVLPAIPQAPTTTLAPTITATTELGTGSMHNPISFAPQRNSVFLNRHSSVSSAPLSEAEQKLRDTLAEIQQRKKVQKETCIGPMPDLTSAAVLAATGAGSSLNFNNPNRARASSMFAIPALPSLDLPPPLPSLDLPPPPLQQQQQQQSKSARDIAFDEPERQLTDEEILAQFVVKNLDTGEQSNLLEVNKKMQYPSYFSAAAMTAKKMARGLGQMVGYNNNNTTNSQPPATVVPKLAPPPTSSATTRNNNNNNNNNANGYRRSTAPPSQLYR